MKNRLSGFTLVELLIVIAILGILAVGLIVAINPIEKFQRTRDAQRKSHIGLIRRALENYTIVNGKYPVSPPSYWIFSNDPAWSTLLGSELKNMPIDPTQKNCVEGTPWLPADQPCWWYAYGSLDGTKYDLVARLENKNDPDRCEIKQWFLVIGNRVWCPEYSNYLYAPAYNQ